MCNINTHINLKEYISLIINLGKECYMKVTEKCKQMLKHSNIDLEHKIECFVSFLFIFT